MSDITNKTKSFNNLVITVRNNLKKRFIFTFGGMLVLFLMLQVTFFSSEAIAAPFGKQIDKMTQGVKTDMAIDKFAGNTKEIARDLRDGNTDKVIDKVADTTKGFAKDVTNGTKNNIGKAKNAAKNAKNDIGEGVEKAKQTAGDRTGDALDKTQELSQKSENKTEGIIDSVKDFLGQ
jgi:hypothetical protein